MKKKTKTPKKRKKVISTKPQEPLISFKDFFDQMLQANDSLVWSTQARSYELYFATCGLGVKETFQKFHEAFLTY